MNWLEWREPAWLWLTLLPIVLYLALKWRRKHLQQTYADPHLWPWIEGNANSAFSDTASSTLVGYWKRGLKRLIHTLKNWVSPLRSLSLAWICLVIAVAEPRQLVWETQRTQHSTMDLMIVLDVSPSMAAEDVLPNRFEQSKRWIESALNLLQPGDRVGLVAFSGKAHLVAPLTHDRALVRHYLQLLEPDFLPTRGSAVELGILRGIEFLQQASIQSPALLVVSDGRELSAPMPPIIQNDTWMQNAYTRYFQQTELLNWPMQILGVGTKAAVVLKAPEDARDKSLPAGVKQVWQYQQTPVRAPLGEAFLQATAKSLQAHYAPLQTSQTFIETTLQTLRPVQAEVALKQQQWHSFAPMVLPFAVLFLILAFYPRFYAGFSVKAGPVSQGGKHE